VSDRIEELNPGTPTEPRPAASVMLLRRGAEHASQGLEVLLARRTPQARFMADVWVFPGGALDDLPEGREAGEDDYRAAALRELEEEVAVRLTDPEKLVPFSRWITPEVVKVRYDTRFYLAEAPPHTSAVPDGEEIVDLDWFAPAHALARHGEGELSLVFPTIKHLEALREFASVDDAIRAAGEREILPILPRIVPGEGGPRVALPGEPGYDG
jgi:8-oxo-dGTP pyrophosphatase MutT (NUDIX family)